MITRYATKGDTFYILLQGKCSVWLPMPLEKTKVTVQAFITAMNGISSAKSSKFKHFNFSIWEKEHQFYTLERFVEQNPVLESLDPKFLRDFWADTLFMINKRLALKLSDYLANNRLQALNKLDKSVDERLRKSTKH